MELVSKSKTIHISIDGYIVTIYKGDRVIKKINTYPIKPKSFTLYDIDKISS